MKNIPDFELCKKLKDAGFPQTKSKFGQFWYTVPGGRVCVDTNNGMKAEYGIYTDDAPTLSFVYAPTIPEMVENMPHGIRFVVNTDTAHNSANLCAEVWLVSQKAKNAPSPSVTTENIMAALSFDADNPKPFYKEARRIAAKHQAEQAEQRADAFKKRFTPGNNILCRLGGTKRGKIFEMFVLGQSPDQAHVKLQDEAGNVFWKEAQDVEVVNVLGNSSDNTETLTAMDATRQESNAEAILNCLKNIERLLETQKTPEMTPCKRFVAGEDLKPGECVYVSTDGAIMKS